MFAMVGVIRQNFFAQGTIEVFSLMCHSSSFVAELYSQLLHICGLGCLCFKFSVTKYSLQFQQWKRIVGVIFLLVLFIKFLVHGQPVKMHF